ncbi:hypothetical protein CSQ91_21650 [Janthinobacterium sp. BJB301]|nr:hypothetical protein CSQ91_21650 [Janthinobacterium sp. BJB301]
MRQENFEVGLWRARCADGGRFALELGKSAGEAVGDAAQAMCEFALHLQTYIEYEYREFSME